MTYEYAVNLLRNMLIVGNEQTKKEDMEAIAMAIDAIMKQIPTFPEAVPQDDNNAYVEYVCGKCDRTLTYGNPEPCVRQHHCICGQKIKWGNCWDKWIIKGRSNDERQHGKNRIETVSKTKAGACCHSSHAGRHPKRGRGYR